jgi:hypothetical protein
MDNTRAIRRKSNSTPSVKSGKNYFLGIGINDYTGGLAALHNAVRDVERVGQILQAKYDFEIRHILTNEQATNSEILKQLVALQTSMSKDDSLLIYYSGHGHLAKEDGYWIPVDTTSANIYHYIPNAQLRSFIKSIPTRHTLLISDACFSGSFLTHGRGNTQGNEAMEEYEKRISRWAFCSGRHDEVVSDGPRGGNSPFASAIINELHINTSKKLNFVRFADKVTEITRANYPQMPEASPIQDTGHAGGQFVFTLRDNEEDDWLDVNPNSVSALEAFKKKHPLSKFGVEADKIIAQLKKEKLIQEHAAVWERTKRINTSDAYLDFWEKYKESPYRSEARQRLADAEDHEEWQRASHTRAGLLDYLDKFPKGLHAADAQAALDIFRNQQAEKLRLQHEKDEQVKREKEKAETDRLEKEKIAKEQAKKEKQELIGLKNQQDFEKHINLERERLMREQNQEGQTQFEQEPSNLSENTKTASAPNTSGNNKYDSKKYYGIVALIYGTISIVFIVIVLLSLGGILFLPTQVISSAFPCSLIFAIATMKVAKNAGKDDNNAKVGKIFVVIAFASLFIGSLYFLYISINSY